MLENPSDAEAEAPAVSDGSERQCNNSSLTHVAAVSLNPKRHTLSVNCWKLLPLTRTSVEPCDTPLLGLRLLTTSAGPYENSLPLLLYCCPFNDTSNPTGDSTSTLGEVHDKLPELVRCARTTVRPNLQR